LMIVSMARPFPCSAMLLSPAADIATRFPGVPGLASVRRSACVLSA